MRAAREYWINLSADTTAFDEQVGRARRQVAAMAARDTAEGPEHTARGLGVLLVLAAALLVAAGLVVLTVHAPVAGLLVWLGIAAAAGVWQSRRPR